MITTSTEHSTEPRALHTMLLDRLSEMPRLWMFLRWLVEDGFRGEKDAIERELRPWEGLGTRQFLDFGCGTGAFAHCFPKDYYTGFDPATHYISFAGHNRRGRFAIMAGQSLGFVPRYFDAALVLGVFHHLPEELCREAASELYRVLKPGATLLVMEDVYPDWWNIPGHLMHMIDRGKFIRSDADYRALFHPYFTLQKAYHMRSGICDYGVYVLERNQ
ncbi:MAG: class I SAM-dependent methyltransferase [Roseiflexaceae bacterium]